MGFLKRPKAPEPTAQELAGVERQSRMLDDETEEMEKRLKAAARGKLGSKSLLAKAPKKASGLGRASMIGGGSGSGAGSGAGGGSGAGRNSGIASSYGSSPTANRK
jgi:hypothetical protein